MHDSTKELIYNSAIILKRSLNMKPAIDELAKHISSLIPADVKYLQDDIEKNVRALLQTTLSKMNLVTREEFDIQSAVLQRSREKLEQLEKQVAQLQDK